jgi:hypothetical protein
LVGFWRERRQPSDVRSPVTAWSNRSRVVDFQDNRAIGLNVGEILSIILGLVLDVSVGGVRTGEEGPVTGYDTLDQCGSFGRDGRTRLTRRSFGPGGCSVICTWRWSWSYPHFGVLNRTVGDSDGCWSERVREREGERRKRKSRAALLLTRKSES